jgi:hypothetical protein|uniref:Uncharacterized protein n=1 Tax=viral metagenome TaxID=1070528 RepID=A0A6C0BG74_9ZZZZ
MDLPSKGMDVTVLKNAVQQQLSATSGLYSLQLQNHIYGCFIIMEDIAQKTVDFSENKLVGPSYSFDMKERFSQIGIRYGFAMDTKLTLKEYPASYQDAWLQTFRDLGVLQDIEYVDAIEECLIEIIQQQVKPEDAYFVQALGSGSLPQIWIDKALSLLSEKPVESVPVAETTETTETDNVQHTGISKALTEKPIKSVKPKHLAVTRRRHVAESVTNKHLSKTRRSRH